MIGIAVCGVGNWGRNLARNFAASAGAALRWVVDSDPGARRRAAKAHPGARLTADLDDALADPDVHAVAVATDAPTHHAVARAALDAGRHVFVEKPLTLQAEDAQDLIARADAAGLTLMVGHLIAHHPAVAYMKRMIAAGEIDPLYAYFQRVNLGVVRHTENAWWSLAPHDVSVACHLFDAEPVEVSATGQSAIQPGIEDVVFANLKFADGRMAHIHVSWLDPHKIRKITLVGRKHMIAFDDMEAAEKVRVYDKGADVQPGVENYAEAITLRTGDIRIPKISNVEPLALECQHFIDCVREGRRPLTDGRDGLRVVRVLAAGSASLAAGGAPIEVGSIAAAEAPIP